jgi:predicted transcriptional regulator
MDRSALAELTAELVKSYIGSGSRTESELDRAIEQLPVLIDRVHEALLKILEDRAQKTENPAAAPVTTSTQAPLESPHAPAGTIEHDHLICREDGKRFKTLARHLRSVHGLTPEAYRLKWGLPDDYPMACPSYAQSRSDVAKRIGLGVNGRGSAPAHTRRSIKDGGRKIKR